MSTTTKRLVAVASSMTLGLVLAACGGDSDGASAESQCPVETPAEEAMADLYKTAVKDGQKALTVYGPGASNWTNLVEDFNECYPSIRVNLVELVGSETLTRLQSEFSSGQHVGDVLFGPTNSGVFQPEYQEWMVPFAPEGGEELFHDPGDHWYAPYGGVFGVGYNEDEVAAEDVPQSYEDLLDPAWKGRIALNDLDTPNASVVTVMFAMASAKVDDAWLERLADQDVRILADAAAIGQSMASGESDLGFYPLSYVVSDRAKGAPIAFAPGTALIGQVGTAVLEGAPNPDAGKLFVSWLLSDTAQQDFADQGQYPLMPGAPLPEGLTEGKYEVSEPLTVEDFNSLTAHILRLWKDAKK